MRIRALSGRALAIIGITPLALVTAPVAIADPGLIAVTEHATTDTVTDVQAHGDSAGDILTFANDVFDATNTTQMGSDQGVCIRVVPGVSWDCRWTLILSDGQVMVQGPYFDQADSTLTIVGGTGRYVDAAGEMELTHIVPDDSSYLFTYHIR
ncbi:MAG: hypothetical protein K2Q25_10935 [Mycobacteriaceae bacterium]|nr:hypothetical protein [Mycobacteriaceae bacterium]